MKIQNPLRLGFSARHLALDGMLTAFLWLLPASANAQAIQAWVQRYNGPGNGDQDARAIAVDQSGNVVVTGFDATIKYSSAGVPLWTNVSGVANWAVAVDSSADVVVASRSSDYVTVKYSSAGVPLWTNRYNGPANSDDVSWALAVDASGDVYVTGYSIGTALPDYDYATIKYSSAGMPLWTRRYNGPGDDMDQAKAVAVDAGGNVFVTGLSRNSGAITPDYLTIGYSSAGATLWTKRYNGPGNWQDEANAVAVDANGNVVVTGRSDLTGSGASLDYATLKYSGAGVPLWTNRYNGPGNNNDEATAVAVDASGNVVVTGWSWGGSSSGSDCATVKYSSAGGCLWTNRYSSPGNNDDRPTALALDAGGNVFVTGYSEGSGTSYDYLTIAYSSAGMPLWTNRYNGTGNGNDQSRAVAVDASGNVYVTGYSTGSGTGSDFTTIKYVTPPIITRQPLSCTNAVGATANFTVEIAGSAPFSYQWRRQGTNLVDGPNLTGVTTTNLVIANVQLADAAGYTVVVTNNYGSTTSSVAQLTVYVPPNPGRFTNPSYSPETGFSFIFRDATVGRPYRIQVSSSLTGGWLDWQSFNYLGPVGFSDLGALETTNRFYRAVSP